MEVVLTAATTTTIIITVLDPTIIHRIMRIETRTITIPTIRDTLTTADHLPAVDTMTFDHQHLNGRIERHARMLPLIAIMTIDLRLLVARVAVAQDRVEIRIMRLVRCHNNCPIIATITMPLMLPHCGAGVAVLANDGEVADAHAVLLPDNNTDATTTMMTITKSTIIVVVIDDTVMVEIGGDPRGGTTVKRMRRTTSGDHDNSGIARSWRIRRLSGGGVRTRSAERPIFTIPMKSWRIDVARIKSLRKMKSCCPLTTPTKKRIKNEKRKRPVLVRTTLHLLDLGKAAASLPDTTAAAIITTTGDDQTQLLLALVIAMLITMHTANGVDAVIITATMKVVRATMVPLGAVGTAIGGVVATIAAAAINTPSGPITTTTITAARTMRASASTKSLEREIILRAKNSAGSETRKNRRKETSSECWRYTLVRDAVR